MLRRSHLFLGITSTFGEYMSLAQGNNTPTRPRIEPGSPDPESNALTTRPVRSPNKLSEIIAGCIMVSLLKCGHISPDSVNGRRTDRKNTKNVYPVMKVVSVAMKVVTECVRSA